MRNQYNIKTRVAIKEPWYMRRNDIDNREIQSKHPIFKINNPVFPDLVDNTKQSLKARLKLDLRRLSLPINDRTNYYNQSMPIIKKHKKKSSLYSYLENTQFINITSNKDEVLKEGISYSKALNLCKCDTSLIHNNNSYLNHNYFDKKKEKNKIYYKKIPRYPHPFLNQSFALSLNASPVRLNLSLKAPKKPEKTIKPKKILKKNPSKNEKVEGWRLSLHK